MEAIRFSDAVRRSHSVFMLTVTLSLLFSGCGGGGGGAGGSNAQPNQPGDTRPVTSIKAQPTDQSVVAGKAASFSISVEGTASIQWQALSNGNWIDISGATSASFALPTTSVEDDGHQYRAVIAPSAGGSAITSAVATLHVAPNISWSFKSPSFIGAELNSVRWVDDGKVAVAVGSNGTIVRSVDGGLTWTHIRRSRNDAPRLTQLLVTDSQTLVASGPKVFMRSSDAGATWSQLPAPWGDGLLLAFRTSQVGIAADATGKAYRTSDGGLTWQETKPVAVGALNTLECNSQVCIATGWDRTHNGNLNAWKSNDDGFSWTEVDFKPKTVEDLGLWAVGVVDANTIYAFGDGWKGRSVGRSADGGATWTWETMFAQQRSTGVRFADRTHGLTLDGSARTEDGGRSWLDTPSFRNFMPQGLALSSSGLSLAVDVAGQIMRSVDFGASWSAVFKTADGDMKRHQFSSLAFSDRQNGLAVSAHDVLFTVDGGQSWTKTNLDASIANGVLEKVAFANPTTAVLVGSSAVRSTDGGRSWQKINSLPWGDFSAVAFSPAGWGLLAGQNGMFRSTDAGASWTMVRAPGTDRFGVFAIRGNVVLAGGFGTMLRSEDAGLTWTQVSGLTEWVYSISWSDAQTAFAVTTRGRLLKSTDAGRSWNAVDVGTDKHLLAVSFSSDGSLGLVSGAGVVLHTTDGGQTWSKDLSGYPFFWYAIAFADSRTPFVAGDNGVIMQGSGY
ncbi:YCF48-related protein [Paucibacter sp. APW11]|uniref:YCF48-related protein n=1 Tax=Roseateles aquae TaxID=3077235 RepID=A0ABU3P8U2_9BURK|nr:YCF48-related protein [Paucibacter sp. APW11]MDT8998969.1 YCF48-related protein [Paucibacter sp. APW11]